VPLVIKSNWYLKVRLQNMAKRKGLWRLGNNRTPDRAKNGWKRILGRAGIKNLRLHDLRRTVGSWQAATERIVILLEVHSGIKDQKIHRAVYARLNIDPIRESLEKATQANVKNNIAVWKYLKTPCLEFVRGLSCLVRFSVKTTPLKYPHRDNSF